MALLYETVVTGKCLHRPHVRKIRMALYLGLTVISGIRDPLRSSSRSFRQNIALFLWNPN